MVSFREWLREAECKKDVKESKEYKEYFKKILTKYNVEDPSELSKEDKQKFFDEVDAGWKGDKEEPEVDDVNESLDKELLKKLATVETIIKIGIDDKSIKKYQIDKCIAILQSINI